MLIYSVRSNVLYTTGKLLLVYSSFISNVTHLMNKIHFCNMYTFHTGKYNVTLHVKKN